MTDRPSTPATRTSSGPELPAGKPSKPPAIVIHDGQWTLDGSELLAPASETAVAAAMRSDRVSIDGNATDGSVDSPVERSLEAPAEGPAEGPVEASTGGSDTSPTTMKEGAIPPRIERTAGLLIPLFSVRSARSLGIGDIADLPTLARWARTGGYRLVQLLPVNALPDGITSPYSAASSFAIDPMYVAVDRLADLDESEVPALLGPDGDAHKWHLCTSPRVAYAGVRSLKERLLRAAFDRFFAEEWPAQSERARALHAFMEQERAWLDDYALYRAIKSRYGELSWRQWPEALRTRQPRALLQARRQLARTVLYHAYVQWIAFEQWKQARKEVAEIGVELMGDMPFMVGSDSADAWAEPGFLLDGTLGCPPDASFPQGQDWGLPAYDWPAMEANDLAWLRRRVRNMAMLYDRFRIDHLIGFYRMWVRSSDGTAGFLPETEEEQQRCGERALRAVLAEAKASNVRLVAEDLGTIPSFVSDSLQELAIPGYKVLMWMRGDGGTFVDPNNYPYVSLATTSTHDTVTLRQWWEGLRYQERRRAVEDLPALRAVAASWDIDWLGPHVHDAILETMASVRSELTLIPIWDLLCSTERLNLPGTVNDHNWTWRLHGTLEDLTRDDWVASRMASSLERLQRHGRIE